MYDSGYTTGLSKTDVFLTIVFFYLNTGTRTQTVTNIICKTFTNNVFDLFYSQYPFLVIKPGIMFLWLLLGNTKHFIIKKWTVKRDKTCLLLLCTPSSHHPRPPPDYDCVVQEPINSTLISILQNKVGNAFSAATTDFKQTMFQVWYLRHWKQTKFLIHLNEMKVFLFGFQCWMIRKANWKDTSLSWPSHTFFLDSISLLSVVLPFMLITRSWVQSTPTRWELSKYI